MQGLKAELLRGCWYVAVPAADVKRGKMVAKTLLGEPVLIARGEDGRAFALRDICPHRGIPLHYGKVEGNSVRCGYHGWRFDTSGTCAEIPSLREGQEVDLSKIRCGAYPTVEKHGLVWIYISASGEPPEAGPMAEVDFLPDVPAGEAPAALVMLPFDCSVDHAAFGLMDPTHAAYVHTSWWFKKNATKLRPKEKSFEPDDYGWRMVRHKLPPQNLVYKIFGKEVTTEIAYRLPGYRIERVAGSKANVVGLTAMTPVDEEHTEVYQIFWTSLGWLKWAGPLVRHLMRTFLDQDRRVVVQQREGLMHGPRLMMINDADTQARWWARVKSEFQEAQRAGRPFVNPLKAQTLRWRS
ncbi:MULTISPECIES: aromatic ring-hydroxylating oxygenase subunit alpha [unclassified Aureimonas]|uniref:aromatic ring-hydroxylating oxygenase subunit alpha n=1 Tax=unclassified Aureimonas TaxID=2615206 RepID=UPI0006F83450|nr:MULTISPECIES: aromatic ring-hydroxylating dioxygenase subunit alpha [unclassified Aureimonas]KQT64219.1 (2Fe-2S)-binding protein [Aureimonas sp. Leaf427]KQT81409.1 (2Fe-2S)-binding protein [Aureimonas sp. Leaf460]